MRRESALKAVLILILSPSPQPLNVLILERTLENTRSSQIKDLNSHKNRWYNRRWKPSEQLYWQHIQSFVHLPYNHINHVNSSQLCVLLDWIGHWIVRGTLFMVYTCFIHPLNPDGPLLCRRRCWTSARQEDSCVCHFIPSGTGSCSAVSAGAASSSWGVATTAGFSLSPAAHQDAHIGRKRCLRTQVHVAS